MAYLSKSKSLSYYKPVDLLRPTFTHYTGNPIRAGGAIIYRHNRGKIELLLIKTDRNGIAYEDFGGKTDKLDTSIMGTIAREVYEESNSLIRIEKQINNSKSYYDTRSKYLLYVIKANSYEKRLRSYMFGNREDGVVPLPNGELPIRTIEWVDINKLPNLHLHPRLANLMPSVLLDIFD